MSAPAPWGRAIRAQAATEVRLTARRGENLLAVAVIPAAVLVFFSSTRVVALPGGSSVEALLPGVLALAIIATGLVNLAIATAYERSYGVLKRLGGSPLGAAGLVLGLTPSILDRAVGLATVSIVRDTAPVHLALWHGASATLFLSAATLAGSVSLFVYRERIRRLVRHRYAGTERLYSLSLTGLDALARWASPALQSASLRSYVLTVVLAGVTAVALALAFALPSFTRVSAPRRDVSIVTS